MADNFDYDSIRNLAEQLNQLAGTVQRTGDPLLDFRTRQQEISAAQKKEAEARRKTAEAIGQFASKVTSSIQSMSGNSGSFTQLNTAVDLTAKAMGSLLEKIPLVGGALSGMTKAAAEGFKLMIAEFDKAYGVFEQLSESGVVRNFEQMQQAAAATGMNFADTGKVLGKYSKELAKFGTSAINGRVIFEEVAAQSQEMRKEFQRIGVTTADFNEYQVSYLQRLQLTGQLEGKTNQQLAQGTADYIKNLDALSKLTGLSRKEIQNELDARMRDTRYRAAIADMTPEQKKQLDNLMTVLPKNMADGMKDLIASGGAAVTDASKQLVINYGDEALEIAKRIRAGTMDASEGFNRLQKSSQRVVDQNKGLAQVIGNNTSVTQNYVENADLASRKQIENVKDLEEQAEKQKKTTVGTNASLADTKQQLYNLGKNIEMLATNSETAAKAMDYFSYGLEQASDAVVTYIARAGGNAKSRAQHYRDREAQAASGQGIFSRMTGGLFGGSSTGAAASLPTDTTSQMAADGVTLSRISTKNGLSTLVSSTHQAAFQGLINELEGMGYPITSLGGYNKRNIAGTNTLSQHSFGAAIDINPSTNPMGSTLITDMPPNIGQIAAKYGLGWGGNWSNKKDAMHFSGSRSEGGTISALRGGITQGPYSGFPATLHGRELIRPLERNTILEKLATTPIQNWNSMGSRTEETNLLRETIRNVRDMNEDLVTSFSTMISVLTTIKNIQEKILRKTYA